MRNFGIIAIFLGVVLYVYAGDQERQQEPLPEGLTAIEALDFPAGRWQIARYGAAGLAGFGILMALFPKGR